VDVLVPFRRESLPIVNRIKRENLAAG
jgi:hypothetical protein